MSTFPSPQEKDVILIVRILKKYMFKRNAKLSRSNISRCGTNHSSRRSPVPVVLSEEKLLSFGKKWRVSVEAQAEGGSQGGITPSKGKLNVERSVPSICLERTTVRL
jgi:hypothetical protein